MTSDDLTSEVLEVVDDDIPVTCRFEVARLGRAVLGRPADERGAQAELCSGGEVSVVSGDHADLVGFETEDIGGAQVRGGIGFVGSSHLGAEDRIPRKLCAFCHVESQADVRVRQRRDDEPLLQLGQPGDRVRPRIEAMPGEIRLLEHPGRDRCGIDPRLGEHGLKVLPMEHIETDELTPAAAHPLHRRLVLRSPAIGELMCIKIGNMVAQVQGHLGGDTAPPVDDGAEHIEDQGLYPVESCCHGFTVARGRQSVYVRPTA